MKVLCIFFDHTWWSFLKHVAKERALPFVYHNVQGFKQGFPCLCVLDSSQDNTHIHLAETSPCPFDQRWHFLVDASLDDRGAHALSECPVMRTMFENRFMGAVWHASHCSGVILVWVCCLGILWSQKISTCIIIKI